MTDAPIGKCMQMARLTILKLALGLSRFFIDSFLCGITLVSTH